MNIRNDILRVSSIALVIGLKDTAYKSLLNLRYSSVVDLDKLLVSWVHLCLGLFSPTCINGNLVLIADCIKIGKEEKKPTIGRASTPKLTEQH